VRRRRRRRGVSRLDATHAHRLRDARGGRAVEADVQRARVVGQHDGAGAARTTARPPAASSPGSPSRPPRGGSALSGRGRRRRSTADRREVAEDAVDAALDVLVELLGRGPARLPSASAIRVGPRGDERHAEASAPPPGRRCCRRLRRDAEIVTSVMFGRGRHLRWTWSTRWGRAAACPGFGRATRFFLRAACLAQHVGLATTARTSPAAASANSSASGSRRCSGRSRW